MLRLSAGTGVPVVRGGMIGAVEVVSVDGGEEIRFQVEDVIQQGEQDGEEFVVEEKEWKGE